MNITNARALPTRDLGFVGYPQRDLDDAPRLGTWLSQAWRPVTTGRRAARLPAHVADALAKARAHLGPMSDDALVHALPDLRARLRGAKLQGASGGWALGLAVAMCRRRLELEPYDTQVLAAWLMLDGQFAEMATGEGKTLAAGLAAAAAALAGVPVHLLTANDYLVQRDRQRLAPLYDGLGLTSACVLPTMARAERIGAYRSDIVVVTARELCFDYLRDHLLLRGERDPRLLEALAITAADRDLDTHDPVAHDPHARHPAAPNEAHATAAAPVLPGLCMAILDEADSILLDEATVPLILAAPVDAVEIRSHERALAIAATLRRGRDYRLDSHRRCRLEDPGRAAVSEQVEALADDAGLLRPLRRAHELVEVALAARHTLRRDRDYVVLQGKLHLVDEVTGRIAEGRQWTGPLQAMVELVEGLSPSPGTRVSAQITYQRFFPRYLRLAGMSGTLLDDARELGRSGVERVRRVPLAKPDRRRHLGDRLFVDGERRDAAVVARVQACAHAGRPVLVGTDSIAASQRLAARLHAAGLEPQVLDATQDAHEAERVARAGHAGVVTVATNMAGRGTDIVLDERARQAGGLHVIATMRNRARRIDRQLAGRAARHGDPGSVESMLALDDAFFVEQGAPMWRRTVAALAGRDGVIPKAAAAPFVAAVQRGVHARESAQRARLRRQEQRADEFFAFVGGVE